MTKGYFKVLAIFSVFAVVIVSFSGAWFLSGVSRGHDGEMNGCIFMVMEEAALCQMGILEHMASWQNMYSGVFYSLLLLMASLAVIFRSSDRILNNRILPRQSRYGTEKADPVIFDYLKRIIIGGILRPKIY